jgi:hypothetical protein
MFGAYLHVYVIEIDNTVKMLCLFCLSVKDAAKKHM